MSVTLSEENDQLLRWRNAWLKANGQFGVVWGYQLDDGVKPTTMGAAILCAWLQHRGCDAPHRVSCLQDGRVQLDWFADREQASSGRISIEVHSVERGQLIMLHTAQPPVPAVFIEGTWEELIDAIGQDDSGLREILAQD